MNTMQRIWSGLQRPLNHLATLFRGKEVDLLLEDDPVGEFLESKKRGVNQAEEEISETSPVADVAPQAVSQAIKGSNKDAAGNETVEVAAQAVEILAQPEAKAEAPAVLAEGEKVDAAKTEAEANAVLLEAKLEVRLPEPVGLKVEVTNTPPANSPQEEEKIESVLDVFRSEGLAPETTGTLSKELNDMNVYSLLEESKQIAQIAKKVKKVSKE